MTQWCLCSRMPSIMGTRSIRPQRSLIDMLLRPPVCEDQQDTARLRMDGLHMNRQSWYRDTGWIYHCVIGGIHSNAHVKTLRELFVIASSHRWSQSVLDLGPWSEALSPTWIVATRLSAAQEISFCQNVRAQQENFRPGIAGGKNSQAIMYMWCGLGQRGRHLWLG